MLIQVLHEAIEAGAKQLQYYYDKDFKISEKEGINNLVTEADKASEKSIIQVIKKHFPRHQILSEEIGNMPTNSEYKWIIDPIDGTVNFAHHIPFCAVRIGIEKNGEIIAGVVYAPLLNEYYFAEKNNGATLNRKPINVSTKQEVAGGKVTNFKGEKYSPYSSFILATNGIIHQPMLENINQIEL